MNLRWSANLLWLGSLVETAWQPMGTTSIRRVNALLVIHTLRALEFLLPVWCLRVLLGSAAGVVAGWQLLRAKPTIRQFDRLPVSWLPPQSQPVRIWRIWRQWTRVNATKFLTFWPDRLASPRWQRRGRCIGLQPLEQMTAWDRPVILGILHYGPVTVLHYWLRARGLAAASLVANVMDHLSISRRHKQLLSDQATGLADVPHVLDRKPTPHRVRILATTAVPQRRGGRPPW